MSRFKQALTDGAKAATVALSSLWLEPKLVEWLPKAPTPALFLIAVAFSALLLEVLLTFVFGRVNLMVEWKRAADRDLLTSLDYRFRPSSTGGEQITVELSLAQASWLGAFLLRRLGRRNLTLQISTRDAPVFATVDSCSETMAGDLLVQTNDLNGFNLSLDNAPSSGSWRHATGSFGLREQGYRSDRVFNVEYRLLVNGKRSWLSARAFKVRADVKKIRVVGEI